MNLTKELREWSRNWSDTNRSLDDIADRIDNQHILIRDHYHNDGYLSCQEDMEDTHIELPKDKNGKTIHVGDFVLVNDTEGKPVDVIGVRYSVGYWDICTHKKDVWWYAQTVEVVEPDTQEKIDKDAKISTCHYFNAKIDDCDNCKNASAAPGSSCQEDHIKDLLRRQRELDGVK